MENDSAATPRANQNVVPTSASAASSMMAQPQPNTTFEYSLSTQPQSRTNADVSSQSTPPKPTPRSRIPSSEEKQQFNQREKARTPTAYTPGINSRSYSPPPTNSSHSSAFDQQQSSLLPISPEQYKQRSNVEQRFNGSDAPNPAGGVSVKWFWQDDGKRWIEFGKPNSLGVASATITANDIEQAYQRGHNSSFSFQTSSEHKYVLDFKKMIQENLKTGGFRPIRRKMYFSDGTEVQPEIQAGPMKASWSYQSANGSWTDFGFRNQFSLSSEMPVTSEDIEPLYQRDTKGTPRINAGNGKIFNVDFRLMQIEDSKSTRNIRRNTEQRNIQRQQIPINQISSSTGSAAGSTTSSSIGSATNSAIGYTTNSAIRSTTSSAIGSATSSAIGSATGVIWYWRDESGKWIEFGNHGTTMRATSEITSDDIETECQRNPMGNMKFIASNGQNYVIDFKLMTQRNTASGTEKRLRRQLPPRTPAENFDGSNRARTSSSSLVTWLREQGPGTWVEFGTGSFITSEQLEQLYVMNKQCVVEFPASNGEKYTIDMADMCVHSKSGGIQKIKRLS